MEGIFAPIITPHHEDGSIDKEGFAGVVDFLIDNKIACIITGGSTGEYYAQTNEERVEIMHLAKKVINGRVPLMVGVGATRTEEAIELAQEAKTQVQIRF